MPIEVDEFDSALEDAVRPADELDPSLVLSGDDDAAQAEDTGEQDARGDSEQDPPQDQQVAAAEPAIDRARERERSLQEATSVEQQWQTEHDRVDAELKAAQERYKEARKKVMADEATDDDEIAAQDAVFEARRQVDKARDSLGQARQWREQVANQPQLSPAQNAWLDANPRYNDDPRFQREAQAAMRELVASGMDPTHQNFYRQVDDKLRAPARMGSNNRRTPGAPAIRTDKRTDADGGARLSASEAKFISKLGYDPRDKRVADQWAKSKANTRRVAAMQGGMR